MSTIRLRAKHQLTLPMSVVLAARLKTDDRLSVEYLNGAIILRASSKAPPVKRESFVGIGKGLWGNTTEEIDRNIEALRDSWER
jgi:hypothetical protein